MKQLKIYFFFRRLQFTIEQIIIIHIFLASHCLPSKSYYGQRKSSVKTLRSPRTFQFTTIHAPMWESNPKPTFLHSDAKLLTGGEGRGAYTLRQ